MQSATGGTNKSTPEGTRFQEDLRLRCRAYQVRACLIRFKAARRAAAVNRPTPVRAGRQMTKRAIPIKGVLTEHAAFAPLGRFRSVSDGLVYRGR